MAETAPDPAQPLVTPRHLVQTFAARHGVAMTFLTLPKTAVLVPVVSLFMKLVRVLEGDPLNRWAWKRPLFYQFSMKNGEKGVAACCPIGAPNVAITIEELAAFGVETLYFLGFAGGIGKRIEPGTLVLPRYAHVGEGTTRYYGNTPLTFPDAVLLNEVRQGLEERMDAPIKTCPLWTTDALYRETRREVERLARAGVCGVDMEVSAVFSVAQALSVRAVALVWISDDLSPEGWEPHFHKDALKTGIDRAVKAFVAVLKGT